MIQLQKAPPSSFDAIYSLLERSFPPDERRSYEGQKALLLEPNYAIYTTKTDGDDCEALLTVWQFPTFAYVEHFAVDPACRGQGLGSQMLNALKTMLPCPICLEVELPETDFARRRIGFYQRNGFFLNEYPYLQPAYGPGKAPVPLLLMTSGGPISPEQFDTMKTALYETVYRQKTR